MARRDLAGDSAAHAGQSPLAATGPALAAIDALDRLIADQQAEDRQLHHRGPRGAVASRWPAAAA